MAKGATRPRGRPKKSRAECPHCQTEIGRRWIRNLIEEFIDEVPDHIILSRAGKIRNEARQSKKGREAMPICCLRCRNEFMTKVSFRFHKCPAPNLGATGE